MPKKFTDIARPNGSDSKKNARNSEPEKTEKPRLQQAARATSAASLSSRIKDNVRRKANIWKKLVQGKKTLDHETEKHAARKHRVPMKALMWSGIFLFISACVYGFGLMATSVHIVITTQKQKQDQSFSIQFSKKLATATADILPLRLYEKSFQYTKTYQATGQSQEPSYVEGTVTIYNKAQRTPQVLVATTRFLSSDGKLFRLIKRTIVPGYTIQNGTTTPGSIQARIRADQPGPSFAVQPTQFRLPGLAGLAKYQTIYGVSIVPFAYAATGTIPVVTEDDIQNAKQSIAQYAIDQTKQDIVSSLPDSIKLLDQALRIKVSSVAVPAKAGTKTSSFSATIQGTVALMVFDEKDITQYVQTKMSVNQSASTLVKDVVTFSYETPIVSFEQGTMTMSVHAKRELIPIVDTMMLQQKTAARTLDDLRRELLAVSGVRRVDIVVWPFWITRVPSNVDKIDIEVR